MRQETAEKFAHLALVPADALEYPGDLIDHGAGDFERTFGGTELGVGVQRSRIDRRSQRLTQVTKEALDELLVLGGQKADRVGEARAVRYAPVGDARREIEHVARMEHPFVFGDE